MVAEITGRKKRIIKNDQGEVKDNKSRAKINFLNF